MDYRNGLLRLLQHYPQRSLAEGQVEIGAYTYGNPDIKFFDKATRLRIGKFCSIAEQVTLFLGGEHRSDWITTYPFNKLSPEFSRITGHPATKGDIIIGNDVWIGYGATVLSGVQIGDGAIIGARALVSKDVPPYAIVGGNPAKLLKYRFSPETVRRFLAVKWWDWEPERLSQAIALLLQVDLDAFFQFAENSYLVEGEN
jgi:acetyltransferase-like isoleucine patch superfamily enzyme